MEGFADEAENRIDQDLLMLESGIRTKVLLRRLAAYKELVSSLSAQHEDFAQRYAERVRRASAARQAAHEEPPAPAPAQPAKRRRLSKKTPTKKTAFDELFADKIATTKIACAKA